MGMNTRFTLNDIEEVIIHTNRTLYTWLQNGKSRDRILKDIKTLFTTNLYAKIHAVKGWEYTHRTRFKSCCDLNFLLTEEGYIKNVYINDFDESTIHHDWASNQAREQYNRLRRDDITVLQDLLSIVDFESLIKTGKVSLINKVSSNTIFLKTEEEKHTPDLINVADVQFDNIKSIQF